MWGPGFRSRLLKCPDIIVCFHAVVPTLWCRCVHTHTQTHTRTHTHTHLIYNPRTTFHVHILSVVPGPIMNLWYTFLHHHHLSSITIIILIYHDHPSPISVPSMITLHAWPFTATDGVIPPRAPENSKLWMRVSHRRAIKTHKKENTHYFRHFSINS